ncbi:MAG: ECF-type riboflavin transporter substrate-binding protein [Lachnospiraceae bacterium]
MKNNGIRLVVAIGIGTALFIVLSWVAIPLGFIPNTAFQTRAALLALIAGIFGPVAGVAVGFLGHALADATQYGSIWWSWVIADGVFGLLTGLFAKKYRIEQGDFSGKKIVLFNVVQVIANAIAWIAIAPILDVLIYAEPANKVFVQGIVAFAVNSIGIGILGTLLAFAYSKIKAKTSSLEAED